MYSRQQKSSRAVASMSARPYSSPLSKGKPAEGCNTVSPPAPAEPGVDPVVAKETDPYSLDIALALHAATGIEAVVLNPKCGFFPLHVHSVCVVAVCLTLASFSVRAAHAQTDIVQAATKSCDVMSGKRTADKQTLQYLLLIDEDASEANPVAIALHREVVKQCPKAYLSYEQRKKVNNPFPAGSLVKQTPTQLTTSNSPQDYALRCHGAPSMASANGKTLVVNFRKSDHPAGQALKPGQCSWMDRALNANEPTRIVDERPTAEKARDTAARLNAGDTWTFWVVNAGTFFKVTASAQGTPTQKP